MIDTMDIGFEFKSKTAYDAYYQIIDNYSYQNKKMRLHKKGSSSHRRYITTAFSKYGFLEIAFFKSKYTYSLRIVLQPIRLLFPNESIKLASFKDYPRVVEKFNIYIDEINSHSNQSTLQLPHLENWTVLRIDYALNYYTPYLKAYLQLLRKGNIPKGFSPPYPNENSFYLSSKNGNINFYDKIDQLNKKHNLITANIKDDFPTAHSLLRLEFQCSNKYIQHLKKRYDIKTATVPTLWNTHIAAQVLKKRLSSVFGKKDFYSLDYTKLQLKIKIKKNRTFSLCNHILLNIIKYSNLSQAKLCFYTSMHCKANYFDQLLTQIHSADINPITLNSITDNTKILTLSYLPNPYNEIYFPDERE